MTVATTDGFALFTVHRLTKATTYQYE